MAFHFWSCTYKLIFLVPQLSNWDVNEVSPCRLGYNSTIFHEFLVFLFLSQPCSSSLCQPFGSMCHQPLTNDPQWDITQFSAPLCLYLFPPPVQLLSLWCLEPWTSKSAFSADQDYSTVFEFYLLILKLVRNCHQSESQVDVGLTSCIFLLSGIPVLQCLLFSAWKQHPHIFV